MIYRNKKDKKDAIIENRMLVYSTRFLFLSIKKIM